MQNSLPQELIAASISITALIVAISAIYWAFTQSRWPCVVVAQVVVFGSGLGVLTLTSPRRRS
jgi:hypothetical protein